MNNLEKVLVWIEDDTQVIPGHGVLATTADLMAFYTMVKNSFTDIRVMKSWRMTVEEVVATGLDRKCQSWVAGFINE